MTTNQTQTRRPTAPARPSAPTQALATQASAKLAPIAVGPGARLAAPEQLGAAAVLIHVGYA